LQEVILNIKMGFSQQNKKKGFNVVEYSNEKT